jgi:hypothetical protein
MKALKRQLTKQAFAIFLSMLCSGLFAQNMSVNSTGALPDNSAMLDVNATNKGLLIPRVTLTGLTNATTPVNAPANSLLIYNSAGALNLGYYYWDGTQWLQLMTKKSGWDLAGNDLTGLTSSFLGTTSNHDLVFKTNNTQRAVIKNDGKVGIANAAPSYQLDVTGDARTYGIHYFGLNGANLSTDQGGSVELGANNSTAGTGTPFIDFHYSGLSQDYNARIINSANAKLDFSTVTGTVMTMSGLNLGVGTTSPTSLFSVGASSQFQVSSSGDLVKIDDVTYNWPSAQGAANTFLKDDGSGNLSWGVVGWTRICDVPLSHAAYYDLTGLNGNVDIAYKIIMMGYHDNPDASNKWCLISPNGDVASANYSYGMDCYWMYRGGYGWAYDAYTTPGIFVWVTDANSAPNYCESETIMSSFTGDKRHAITRYSLGLSGKDIVANLSVGMWSNTTTNISSLYFQWTGTHGTYGFTGRLIVYALR